MIRVLESDPETWGHGPSTVRGILDEEEWVFRDRLPRLAPGALVPLLQHQADSVRVWALFELGRVGATRSEEAIAARLEDPDRGVRAQALRTLVAIEAGDGVLGRVSDRLRDEDPIVRIRAIEALARPGGREHSSAIAALSNDEWDIVRTAAVRVLGEIFAMERASDVEMTIRDRDPENPDPATRDVSPSARSKAGVLVPLLRDPAVSMRSCTIRALGRSGDPCPWLRDAVKDILSTPGRNSPRRGSPAISRRPTRTFEETRLTPWGSRGSVMGSRS